MAFTYLDIKVVRIYICEVRNDDLELDLELNVKLKVDCSVTKYFELEIR